jgi:hypothetical protein
MGRIDAANIIEALKNFPFPDVAKRVIERYHERPQERLVPFTVKPTKELIELTVCANYAFVKMAKK